MKNRFWHYAVVAGMGLMFFAYYQFQSPYLETDGYYHSKMACLMRESGWIQSFKWAQCSFWRDRFSDKELLFHVYLIPFTLFPDVITGTKIGIVLLASGVLVSFFAILRLNNVKAPWLWVALLLVSGGYFLYRVNVVRPQVLSILFVLWSIHFILNKKRIALAILCFIYTFSYTAFHLPFIFASLVYGFHLLFENENDWKTPLTALLAMVSGMLASPYFPDNFLMFYVQNFFIPWMSAGGGVDLHMGGEFSPMHTRAAITVNVAVVLPLVIAFVLAICLPEKHERKTLSLLPIVLFLIFITCLSKRFTEYSVPVTLLFCGFFFTPYIKKYLEYREPNENVILLSAAGIMLAGLAINSHASTVQAFRGIGPPVLEEAAKYLLKHTEEDEVVFTADWDDAPELFYFNHKNRYLVFLDPCFMYYWNPEVWRRWDAVSNGRMGSQTYTVLKDEFRVRYGVATNNFQQLRSIIERDPKMRIVHQTSGAFVFKLDIAQDTAPAQDAAGSN